MDKVLYKICDMFHEVLEEYAEKGRFADKSDVQLAKAAVSGITKIKTIEAMERFDGNSYRGYAYDEGYMGRRSYDDGGSYRGSYDDGGSYRRGRGMDGRFVSRDSDGLEGKLVRLMEEAKTEHERNEIRKMLDNLK